MKKIGIIGVLTALGLAAAGAAPSTTVVTQDLVTFPLATNAVQGAMKGDSVTINCSAGICSAVGGSATSVVLLTTTVGGGGTPGQQLVVTSTGCSSGSPCVAQVSGATLQQSPTNPLSTGSTTARMMGLGKDQAGSGAHPCTITPVFSGRIKVEFIGNIFNTTASDQSQAEVWYGTGTAPSNAAVTTGTQIGNAVWANNSVVSGATPFVNGGIITGLTVGTAYWFDLSLVTVAAGNAGVENVSCNAFEF